MAIEIDLEGKVVIVTGGGRGVGRGIVTRFLDAGADVVFCGRNEPESLPEGGGRKAVFVAADVRDVEEIDRLVTATTERFGRLDVVVNNAGGAPPSDSATVSPRFNEAIVRLNLLAPMNLAQRANRVMQEQDEGGVIINIASISAIRPSPLTVAYAAAKAGLLAVTATLAVEWAPKVRTVAVTAGMVATEQSDLYYGDDSGGTAAGSTVPLQRLATPADIGDACVFLASPMASYVSGSSLLVHGGGEAPSYLEAVEDSKE
jgi:NAD(P)-dependent dehydrogenase (short-subunit alcohol dehydrogenase family)